MNGFWAGFVVGTVWLAALNVVVLLWLASRAPRLTEESFGTACAGSAPDTGCGNKGTKG